MPPLRRRIGEGVHGSLRLRVRDAHSRIAARIYREFVLERTERGITGGAQPCKASESDSRLWRDPS